MRERERFHSSLRCARACAQLVAGAVDVGLHGAEREVQDVGDLLVGPALDVPQQDAGAVLGPELRDGGLDRAAQLAGLHLVERRTPAAVADLQRRGLDRLGRFGVRRAVEQSVSSSRRRR